MRHVISWEAKVINEKKAMEGPFRAFRRIRMPQEIAIEEKKMLEAEQQLVL